MSRSLAHLRKLGYMPEIVESHNSFSGRKKDAWGILDVIAVKVGEAPLGLQITSGDNVAARYHKLQESDALPVLLDCGWQIEVWGWRKNSGNRWILRRVDAADAL